MSSTVVVALGGNALGNSAQVQFENASTAAAAVAKLVEVGYRVVIAHGNGPQVGLIKKCFDESGETMPLVECIAMSQGYIGHHLQQALQVEFKAREIQKSVATILTQVVIDKNDAAFQNPSKPIGAHYTEQTAQKLMAESGHVYVEEAGRGIACGGGGIPVVAKDGFYQSVDAVIDKDYAAAKLAELLEADFLFILTAVDRVSLNYRKIDEKTLNQITIAEAQEYIKQGHFAPGSMLPKVEAGILFAQSGNGRKAIIGSLEKTSEALAGKSGTIITDT